MQAQLQRLERAARDHDLAVKHEAVFTERQSRAATSGKYRSSGFWLPRLKVHAAATCAMQRKPSYFGSYCHPLPEGSSSTDSASIGGRSRGSGVEVAVIGSPVSAGSVLPEILLLAPEHNAQRAIWQRPLERLDLSPWRVQPCLPLLRLSQDHRHGLGMDRPDLSVGLRSQQPEQICGDLPFLDRPHRRPARPDAGEKGERPGYAPLDDVQSLRIAEAKQMLETTGASIEAIAEDVGYTKAAAFRRISSGRPGSHRSSIGSGSAQSPRREVAGRRLERPRRALRGGQAACACRPSR